MKKKKIVCIDVNSTLGFITRGYITGVGRTVYELINALESIKNEIPFEIILYSQNRHNISSKKLNFNFRSKHFNLPQKDFIKKFESKLMFRKKIINYDLFHCPHNTDIVDNISDTIFTIHDLILFNYPEEFADGGKEWIKQFLPVLNQTKAIITCSESSKNDLIKYCDIDSSKVHVIYWGINHDLFKPASNKIEISQKLKKKHNIQQPYYFSVSCGYGRKNTLELIKAYLKLLEQNPKNDLVLVWNNYKKDISQLISKHSDRIHILNNINDDDLVELYNGATAVFYPSKWEGFGFPLLEAMSCGIPVVTCKNSSLKEIGADIAIYSKTEDHIGLLETMVNFESNKYDLDKIRYQGIQHASKFTWEKCARETINIYLKYLNLK